MSDGQDGEVGGEQQGGGEQQSGGEQQAQTAWTEGLSEEDAALVGNKGWATVTDAIKSYRNLESFRGVPESELLRIPKADDADGMSNLFNKLGRPDNPESYDIQGEAYNAEVLEAFKPVAHELGLTQTQAAKLAEWQATFGQQAAVRQQEQLQLKEKEQVEDLKKSWGRAFDERSQIVDRVAQQFGINEDNLQGLRHAMGPAGAMEFLYGLSEKLGEAGHVEGETSTSGVLTPGGAKQRIAELKMDKQFLDNYLSGNADAVKMMNRLQEQAYG